LVIDSPNSFLDGLLKRPADAHDFTNTFHAAAEKPANAVKLLEIPTRDLHDAVIQAGLEACAGDLRDGILDFVQRDAKTEFGSYESQWVASGFRS